MGAGRWDDAGTVGGFAAASPNVVLLDHAGSELARRGSLRVLLTEYNRPPKGRVQSGPVIWEGTFRRA